jgi:hypothetical protein
MIEAIQGVPDGVIGFRFSGHVSKKEYADVLAPPLKERIARKEKIRLILVIDSDFDRFEAGALWEDTKFGLGTGLEHLSAWERMALVSDASWVHHAISLFGWMVPGEVHVFPLAEQSAATTWVAS